MQSILEQITDWLKSMIISGIMGNLSGMFDSVNQQVGQIAGDVGTTPANFSPAVFSMIRNISESVILPIAGMVLTFIACYELIQMLIEHKLRIHKKKAGGIAISIRNNELYTKEWQCRISIPTQSPTYLAKTAFALFVKNYQWEHPIRSVTVRAINLFEEDCPIQYDLFTDVKSLDRQERLDAAIEQIRFRFGKDAIKNGVLFQKSKMPTERKVDLVMPTGMIG